MTQTSRIGLPLLAAGQAQKEVAHNEALLRLDIVAQPVAQSADLMVPPVSPVAGQCWIVGEAASGDWADKDNALAGWTDNGWRFALPAAGWRSWVCDRDRMMQFDGAAWIDEAVHGDGYYIGGLRVLAAQQGVITEPTGGTMVDAEARMALDAILEALRNHGLIAT